jgi:hypothetical protein
MRSIRVSLLIGALASALYPSGGSSQEVPVFWGKLKPGPHAIGFKSVWELDFSRTYNRVFEDKTTFAPGKAPRPILINTWYPAKKPDHVGPMLHREYLAIETRDPRLTKFATQLRDYERSVICRYVMGQPAAKLSEVEQRLFDRFWDSPTAALRDAPPADGKFPIVIYHAGAGSSFEDNAVLCEFLASHGYMFVGSAFQQANGGSFNVDAGQGSFRDIEFLIAHASRFPQADWNHIGLAGHSAGAHASLRFRATEACAVDAVVSLDTTQDYYSLATHGWEEMTEEVLRNVEHVTGPVLFVANAHAVFDFADSLKFAERYYLTFREQDHEEFISQGIMRRLLASWAKPDDAKVREELERVRANYTSICVYILQFFNVYLKADTSRRNLLIEPYARNPLGGQGPHVDHVPVGVSGAVAFRDEQDTAPAPRQIRRFVAEHGVAATVALLKRLYKKDPTAPVFHEDLGFALVDELLERGRDRDAVAVFQLYGSFDPANLQTYVRWGNQYRRLGAGRVAEQYYTKALRLDPTNRAASEGLKALRGPGGK